jgi:2-oxo-3-hexenedioate decarboxylase
MTNNDQAALTELQAIAGEAFAVLNTGDQISPFSARFSGFNLEAAYRVTAAIRQMREAHGEVPMGRKIGFTNRTLWTEYGVGKPIWGYVYDQTVHNLADLGNTFSLAGLAEPRIEPEIVFKLALAPDPDMDEMALLVASIGSAMVSKSCSQFSRDGNFRRLTRSRLSACTVPC